MKSLLRFAMAAAITGALVNVLIKQSRDRRNGESVEDTPDTAAAGPEAAYDDSTRVPSSDAVADTNSVGDESRQRGPQPQDWHGAQNVTE